MGCCNDKRSAVVRHAIVRAAAIAQSRPAAPSPEGTSAVLRYTGPPGLSLRGPISGLVYRPGRKGARINVDKRDVATLLRTNLFEPD